MIERERHRDHQRLVRQQHAGAIDDEQDAPVRRDALDSDGIDAPPQPVESAQDRGADRLRADTAPETRERGEQLVERDVERAQSRRTGERVRRERRVDLALECAEPFPQRTAGRRGSLAQLPRTAGAHDAQMPDLRFGHVRKLGDPPPPVKLRGLQIDSSRDPQL